MSSSQESRRQLYEKLVGQTVADRYDIVSLMGYGGMGAVYEAIQRNMDRRIALKYIPAHDPVMAARFEREALTVSKLRHPNTVTVFDYGQTDDGFLFLSMELLSGKTLTEVIEHEAPLEPQRAVHIASQICRSLAEAHEMGIVHRDIKPDNVILIEVDGDPDVVKVLDFGIAKAVGQEDEEGLTGTGRIVGTPRYMSPDQILSEEIDHRSDIYSVGCIIFELLTGAPPFDAPSTTALMLSHTQDPPPPFANRLTETQLDDIPLGLEQVVRRSMAKDVDQRPQSTEDLRLELEEALAAHQAGRPPEPRDVPTFNAPEESSETTDAKDSPTVNPLLIGGIAVTALILIGLATALVFSDDDPDEVADPLAAETPEDEPEDAVPPSQRDDDGNDEMPPTIEIGETFQLRIESEPDGAEIIGDDDQIIGETPMNFATDRAGTLEYRLTKDDYKDKEINLDVGDATDDQVFAFELEAEPRPTRARRPSPPAASEQEQTDDDDDADEDDDTPDIPTL